MLGACHLGQGNTAEIVPDIDSGKILMQAYISIYHMVNPHGESRTTCLVVVSMTMSSSLDIDVTSVHNNVKAVSHVH